MTDHTEIRCAPPYVGTEDVGQFKITSPVGWRFTGCVVWAHRYLSPGSRDFQGCGQCGGFKGYRLTNESVLFIGQTLVPQGWAVCPCRGEWIE